LAKASPSVRVSRAETRLAVYRSPLVCKNNMDAESASRDFWRRACADNAPGGAGPELPPPEIHSCMIHTESISVRAIKMLPQAVGFLQVKRACVKLDLEPAVNLQPGFRQREP
jgi:hypothetical protein